MGWYKDTEILEHQAARAMRGGHETRVFLARTFGLESWALESTVGVLVREDVEPFSSESIGGALGGRPRVAIRFGGGGVGSNASLSSSSMSTAFRFFGDDGPTAVAADVTDAETEGDLAL